MYKIEDLASQKEKEEQILSNHIYVHLKQTSIRTTTNWRKPQRNDRFL